MSDTLLQFVFILPTGRLREPGGHGSPHIVPFSVPAQYSEAHSPFKPVKLRNLAYRFPFVRAVAGV